MKNKEFDTAEYDKLIANGYKFIELQTTGKEVETSQDHFKKEILLIPYKIKPDTSSHYIMDITDEEINDLLHGSDTDIFYLQNQ